MTQPGQFAPMPTPPEQRSAPPRAPPQQIKIASILLVVNLVLSLVVTILYVVDRHAILRLTLEQHPKLDPADARRTVNAQIWSRGAVNIVVALLYLFIISRLYRGKRWAWRRLVWLSVVGGLGLIFLLTQPYPAIFKVEQVVQLLVLAGIAACVLHPTTRAHYAKR